MSSPDSTTVRPAADSRHAVERLAQDEEGAVFLEFLIVLFAFMFILFGVAQVGLIVMASFFTNYANFMALRTAAVRYEMKEDQFITQSKFESLCEDAAISALLPMEPFIYKNQLSGTALLEKQVLKQRVKFVFKEGDQKVNNKPATLLGRLEYDYYCIVPFAGNVIAALGQGKNVPSSNRNMQNFVTVQPLQIGGIGEQYPRLKLRTSNELARNKSGSPPYFNEVVIQRRWLY